MALAELLKDVAEYIEQHYVEAETQRAAVMRSRSRIVRHYADEYFDAFSSVDADVTDVDADAEFSLADIQAYEIKECAAPTAFFEEHLMELDEAFSETLLKLIDSKGKSDAEIYKRAGIDRKLFSKIRNPDYRPSKKTAIALALALELNLEETGTLLKRAGFTLSHSVKFDVIVEYFITHSRYDLFEINKVLLEYDQQLL